MPRSVILSLVAVVVAVVGVAAVAALLAARDDATVTPSAGPGATRPEGATPQVDDGNVVLLYGDERLTRRLRALALEVGGPPDGPLVAAGQAVLVRRRPGLRVPVVAVSASHRLDAGGPDDPVLRPFVEYWLGREPAR